MMFREKSPFFLMSALRKRVLVVALLWGFLFLFLFWVRTSDFMRWMLGVPVSQILSFQLINSVFSSIIIVELLRMVVLRWGQWNDRQHFWAVFYTWILVFVMSVSVVFYARLMTKGVVP